MIRTATFPTATTTATVSPKIAASVDFDVSSCARCRDGRPDDEVRFIGEA
jgi:hypothetical protein